MISFTRAVPIRGKQPKRRLSTRPQVRYKLANTVWKRLYKAKRSRYTGGAAPTTAVHSRTSLAVAVALLCALALPAVILPMPPS